MATPRFMTKLRFGVFGFEDEWELWAPGHRLGRYSRRPDAISAGERAADQASGSAYDVELLVMNPNGELRVAERLAPRDQVTASTRVDGPLRA